MNINKFSFILILIISLLFITLPKKSLGSENFLMEMGSSYDFTNKNYTLVTVKNSVTNLNQDIVLSNQVFDTGFSSVFDTTVNSNNKFLEVAIENNGNGIINIRFDNPIVGKGVNYYIETTYKTYDALKTSGMTTELRIPKISKTPEISKYDISLIIPKYFGLPSFSSPKDFQLEEYPTNYKIIFSNSEIFNSGITMYFGNSQFFSFELSYDLPNNSVFSKTFDIPIPPNIEKRQEVFIKEIQPAPTEIFKDLDSNYFAKIKVSPNKTATVKVFGFIKVVSQSFSFDKSGKINDIPEYIKTNYTKQDAFWEASDPQIKKTAQSLVNSNLSITQNVASIYKFVTNKLTYGYDKSRLTRLGAVNALSGDKDAVCMEYSDLMITLLRSSGIPAREIEGFAYTEDLSKKPISVLYNQESDFLHSWVEFYDPVLGWISVDPTWGDTSGLDYFNNMDTNHITFVTKGQSSTTPLPPGSFRLQDNNSKQILISYAEADSIKDFKNIDTFVTTKKPVQIDFIKSNRILEIFAVALLCGSLGFVIFHLFSHNK